MPITSVSSRSPEALLSFTTNTATTLLPCSTNTKLKNNSFAYCNNKSKNQLPPLNEFIAQVFKRSKLSPCVCLVSLIYLQRLKLGLPSHARGDVDTPYRLFLAAILTASKFLSETGTCLTSQAIVVMTDHVYTPKDINLMERSFLGLIKYNLFVNVQAIKEYLAIHGKTLEMDLVEEVLDH
ncbi:cyclin domain-containing protein [Gilbertella persicaria]|uniref:cyclin domain-containing protein n=1 Tax=Gilbertella persicaria TaxID=101096 RepID=UPI00221EF502|nr:cyclin domain-containing protein [Gilbertella persicaria]KAI8095022.1 cyclin domain-containing protein [Gilbertella persicaria]